MGGVALRATHEPYNNNSRSRSSSGGDKKKNKHSKVKKKQETQKKVNKTCWQTHTSEKLSMNTTIP
jgi:hypothetical protein